MIVVCVFAAISATAQETDRLRLGMQLGTSSNYARMSGGMEHANGRFRQNDFGAANINIIARYDVNSHWMLESGLGINTFGFSYSISEDYSLRNSREKLASLQTDFAALEMPVDIFYKFRLNCRNVRAVLGMGVAPTFIGAQHIEKDFSVTSEGTSGNYLKSYTVAGDNSVMFLRYHVGIEKLFRNGSVFRASILINIGFSDIARSAVDYTLDNENYSHSFTNSGSAAGFRLAWFLPGSTGAVIR